MLHMQQQLLVQTPKVCGVAILQKSHALCKLHTAVDIFIYI